METLSQTIAEVVRRYPEVRLAYLFGSRATGTDGPTSDVDVAVFIEESDAIKRVDARLAIQDDMTRALATDRVEVVLLDLAGPPEFNYRVICEGIVIHEDESSRITLEPRIINAYIDFRDSLRRHGLTAA